MKCIHTEYFCLVIVECIHLEGGVKVGVVLVVEAPLLSLGPVKRERGRGLGGSVPMATNK